MILKWNLGQDGRGTWQHCPQGTSTTAFSYTSPAQIMKSQDGPKTRRNAQTCSTTTSPTWTSTTALVTLTTTTTA